MAENSISDFLASITKAKDPADLGPTPPAEAPAPAPEKPPMPDMIRDLIKSPPEGSDPVAAIKAYALSCTIPDDFLASIVSSPPAGYTETHIEAIRAMLPEPAPVEVAPEPAPLVAEAPAGPAPKKTRRSRKPKDGAPLTREERLALACAVLRSGVAASMDEMSDFVVHGAGE